MRFLRHTILAGLMFAGLVLMGGGGPALASAPDPIPTTGTVKIFVLVFNFHDTQHAPWTIAEIEEGWAGGVVPWYTELSYDQLTVDADVYGYYTLESPMNDLDCDTYWYDAALAAIDMADQDIDYAEYDGFYIFFGREYPPGGCPNNWLGGGASIVIVGDDLPDRETGLRGGFSSALFLISTVRHELTHAMGIGEGNALECGDILGRYCTWSRYGDAYSIMGSMMPYHLPANVKDSFGWFEDPDWYTEVTSSGTYYLWAFEEIPDPVRPVMLKLPGGLYLEFRTSTGYDQNIDVADQILIHDEDRPGNPWALPGNLLDASPENLADPTYDRQDCGLELYRDACISSPLNEEDNVSVFPYGLDPGVWVKVYVTVGATCTATKAETWEMAYGGPGAWPSPMYKQCAIRDHDAPWQRNRSSDTNFGFYYCAEHDTSGAPFFEDVIIPPTSNPSGHPSYTMTATLCNNGVRSYPHSDCGPGTDNFSATSPALRGDTACLAVDASKLEINVSEGAPHYNDIEGHWCYEEIETLYTYGVIDNQVRNFFPDQAAITESEAMSLIQGLADTDVDDDGYNTGTERYVGTIPDDDCPATADPNDEDPDAWPPDFDDNQVINILDVGELLGPVFGKDCGDDWIWEHEGGQRADLVPDCVINVMDLGMTLPPYFGTTCSP